MACAIATWSHPRLAQAPITPTNNNPTPNQIRWPHWGHQAATATVPSLVLSLVSCPSSHTPFLPSTRKPMALIPQVAPGFSRGHPKKDEMARRPPKFPKRRPERAPWTHQEGLKTSPTRQNTMYSIVVHSRKLQDGPDTRDHKIAKKIVPALRNVNRATCPLFRRTLPRACFRDGTMMAPGSTTCPPR